MNPWFRELVSESEKKEIPICLQKVVPEVPKCSSGTLDTTPQGDIFQKSQTANQANLAKDACETPARQTRDSVTAADSWGWIEERAAIMEYDGGLSRDQANHRAFMEWFVLYVERSKA